MKKKKGNRVFLGRVFWGHVCTQIIAYRLRKLHELNTSEDELTVTEIKTQEISTLYEDEHLPTTRRSSTGR